MLSFLRFICVLYAELAINGDAVIVSAHIVVPIFFFDNGIPLVARATVMNDSKIVAIHKCALAEFLHTARNMDDLERRASPKYVPIEGGDTFFDGDITQ